MYTSFIWDEPLHISKIKDIIRGEQLQKGAVIETSFIFQEYGRPIMAWAVKKKRARTRERLSERDDDKIEKKAKVCFQIFILPRSEEWLWGSLGQATYALHILSSLPLFLHHLFIHSSVLQTSCGCCPALQVFKELSNFWWLHWKNITFCFSTVLHNI